MSIGFVKNFSKYFFNILFAFLTNTICRLDNYNALSIGYNPNIVYAENQKRGDYYYH